MSDLLVQVLAAIGGVGVLVLGISRLVASIVQNYLKERSWRSTELELEYNRQRLAPDRIRAEKFTSMQFEAYHTLWRSLHALRRAGDALWQEVSPEHLAIFAKQLRETKQIVGDGVIFFEEREYEELNRLLEAFSSYEVGKIRLYKIRSRREVEAWIDDWSLAEAQRQIHENSQHKQCYESLLDEIRVSFRNRLSRLQRGNAA